jgi:hypothetical protein
VLSLPLCSVAGPGRPVTRYPLEDARARLQNHVVPSFGELLAEGAAAPWSVLGAQAAGLTVVDLREFRGRMEFCDIAAVVHFLRKVVWTVPGFTVAAYRDRLRALHERIGAEGLFAATSARFLIEARKPQGAP